eukprot:2578809-Pleurochrysis_carterae.AAC.8
MSDCLAGLNVIEKVWRGNKNLYRKLQNGAVLEAITNVRETLGTVIFMWIPSHVGIIPNILADNIASQDQEEAPEGMVIGIISKQNWRIARFIRRLGDGEKGYKGHAHPPEGGYNCESGIARGLIEGGNTKEEEESDREMDIERQEGKREVEKFVHGLRNGEIVGGPARERRMRHATKEGNRPSFWTYLMVNGCRSCQRQEEEETIHHVLSGGCEGIGKTRITDISWR